jgi:hypothetical protein
MAPVFVNIGSAAAGVFTDPDDAVSERLLGLVPRRYSYGAPGKSLLRFQTDVDLPPDAFGYIPLVGFDHTTSVSLDGVSLTHRQSDATFALGRIVAVSLPETRSNARFGLLPIAKRMPENQFLSPLGSVHLIMLSLSFILSIPSLAPFHEFLKRVLLPRLAQTENFISNLFLFSVLSPLLTRLAWTPDDATPEIVDGLTSLSTRYSKAVTTIGPLHRGLELGVLIAASASDLLATLTRPRLPADAPPELVNALFRSYAASALSLEQADAFTKCVRLVTLFSALGHDLPIPVRFPTALFASVWSGFGAPADAAADFAEHYATFSEHADFMAHRWQRRWDVDLSRVAGEHPALLTAPSLDAFALCAPLQAIPARLTWTRLRLMALLNGSIDSVDRLIPDGRAGASSLFAQLHAGCRFVLSTAAKVKRAETVVIARTPRAETRLEMTFNRYAAREFLRDRRSSIAKSLMQQTVEQFEADPARLPLFHKTGVPWHVSLTHEGATDAGGPGRDVFTDLCLEIMHPSLALFVPAPNSGDTLIPSPEPFARGSLRERMFFYTGVVLSVCYISRMQAPFRFARFVWGALAGAEPTVEDIFEIDGDLHSKFTSIKQTGDEVAWAASHHFAFEIPVARKRMVELFPGGSQVIVTFERRMEFVERAQKYRLKEFAAPLDALRRGFHVFFSPAVAALFAPWEMELLCCGPNDCPVEELKKLCTIQSPPDADRFWSIIERLTPHERKMFVKFGTGRGGLPPPGVEWQQKLQIFFSSSSRPDWHREMPTAETCFSKIRITRYDSDEVYLLKLRAAISFGVGIEDHAPNWNELRAFTT